MYRAKSQLHACFIVLPMIAVDAMAAVSVAAKYASTIFSNPVCARIMPPIETTSAEARDTIASIFALPRKIRKTEFAANTDRKTAPTEAKVSMRTLVAEPPRCAIIDGATRFRIIAPATDTAIDAVIILL